MGTAEAPSPSPAALTTSPSVPQVEGLSCGLRAAEELGGDLFTGVWEEKQRLHPYICHGSALEMKQH
ncbi:hypothetical protein GRJ2_000482300 [Grus japonensis]|uniref:Uncharacterized protein n=1 Tax=Grus japonensis TaxID=30415 RepID=A0ABC9W440_GRUJA